MHKRPTHKELQVKSKSMEEQQRIREGDLASVFGESPLQDYDFSTSEGICVHATAVFSTRTERLRSLQGTILRRWWVRNFSRSLR
jgi:hypothetical protein